MTCICFRNLLASTTSLSPT